MTSDASRVARQVENSIDDLARALRRSSSETTDAIRSMARDLVDAVQETSQETNYRLDTLNEGIQAVRQGLDGVRERLQRTVEELEKATESSARIEVAKQIAELEVIGPELEELSKDLCRRSGNINNRMATIVDKFESIAGELESSYNRDVRRLGDYIYDIVENQYGETVAARTETPGFQIMVDATQDNSREREQLLARVLEQVTAAGDEYVEALDRHELDIQSWSREADLPTLHDETFAVPFWVVTVENARGEEEAWVVPPSALRNDQPSGNGQGEAATALPLAQYSELTSLVQRRVLAAAEEQAFGAALDEQDIESMGRDLETLQDDGVIGPIMLDFIRQALSEQPIRLGEGVRP